MKKQDDLKGGENWGLEPLANMSNVVYEKNKWKACAEKLAAWINNIDIVATNFTENREWHGGGLGWLYPEHAGYYGHEVERKKALETFNKLKDDK